MLDAHIHLQDVSVEIRKDLISYLCDQKFTALFCNGTSPKDWSKVLTIADLVENVKPFIGIHPWFVDDLPSNWETGFVHSLRHDQCGVGEIGLDNTHKGGDFERQKILFVRQLDMAIMFGRAFMLHCVKSWDPMMTILRTYDFHGIPFVIHSFIGSNEILSELLTMGAMISISVRSLGQQDADQLIRSIPVDQILIETDFPYLPGQDKNEVGVDSYVKAIRENYERTAGIRNVSIDELSKSVTENARKVLNHI